MSDTRQQITDLADNLIRSKGYNAFSFKDIAAPLEIKNAAVHYHFPTKESLGIAIVTLEMQRLRDRALQWEILPEDMQLRNFFETFHQRNKQTLICLMGSLAPDFETLPPLLQEKVQEMCDEIVEWMQQLLKKGRKSELIHFEGKAQDKALTILASLIASLLLARVRGKDAFTRIHNQLLAELIKEN